MILLLSGYPSAFYAQIQIIPQHIKEIARIIDPATVKIERDNYMWNGAMPFVVYGGDKEKSLYDAYIGLFLFKLGVRWCVRISLTSLLA